MRCAAGLVMGALALGIGTSGAWAERVEAIAVVASIDAGSSEGNASNWQPVLELVAVFEQGKWISGAKLQERDPHASDRLKHQHIYELLKGRTFLPADGSSGRFVAGAPFFSEIAGDAHVMACQSTRSVDPATPIVVVTKRGKVPGEGSWPIPNKSVFLPFARKAINGAERRHLEYRRGNHLGVGFEPSSKIPVLARELKPVTLYDGAALYWVKMEKVYDNCRFGEDQEPFSASFLYYGLFSGALPGPWRVAWEDAMYSDQGEGMRSVGSPAAVCDVNGDSLPELVMQKEYWESAEWTALELHGTKLREVGSLSLGW